MDKFFNFLKTPTSSNKVSPIASTRVSPYNSPRSDDENNLILKNEKDGKKEKKLYLMECEKGHKLSKYASMEGEKMCEICDQEYHNNIHKEDFQFWCDDKDKNIKILGFTNINKMVTYHCQKCSYTNKVSSYSLKDFYKINGRICQNPKHLDVNNEILLNKIFLLSDIIDNHQKLIDKKLNMILHRLTILENKIYSSNGLFQFDNQFT